jgi:hypothetical protein
MVVNGMLHNWIGRRRTRMAAEKRIGGIRVFFANNPRFARALGGEQQGEIEHGR